MSLSQPGARSQPDLLESQETHVKRVMGSFSTNVRDNTAMSNSNLFAGPVADTVITKYVVNYNFNLFVGNHTRPLGGNSLSYDLPSRTRSATAPGGVSHRPQLAPKNTQTSSYSVAPRMKQPPIPPKQYVTMHSKSDVPHIVLAQLRSEVQENWISRRIVSRLELELYDEGTEKSAVFDGTPLRSAGKVVGLHCSSGGSGKLRHHKFHVIRNSSYDKFDLLLGADILFWEEKT